MNTRNSLAVLLAIVLLTLAVPYAFQGSDAVDANSIVINVDGGSDSIVTEMTSDSTTSVTIFVVNQSDTYLSLNITDIHSESLSTSSSVSVNGTSSNLIYPAGDTDGRNIAIVTVTLTTDRLADTSKVSGTLYFEFTDVSVAPGPDTDNTFVREVPVTVDINSVYTAEGSYNQFFGLFPNTLPAPMNTPWFAGLVTLVLWIVFTVIVCELMIPLFTKLVGNRKSPDEKKKLTSTLTKTISVLMFVVAINECLNIVGANAEVMSQVATWSLVLYVLIGAVLAWQIYVFVITAIINGIDDNLGVKGVDSSLIPLFKMIGKLVICVLAATIILAAFGVDLAGIMVSAGVITLGITFGAQEIISQFFSGIVLLSTRPFKKGDFVSLNGNTYIVHKVRLMYTEFENWDRDQIVTMPNNSVSSAVMVNYTKGSPRTRIFIYVTVAYNANLSLAKELMIRAAKMHPHVINDHSCVPPVTRLTEFQDSGIEYRLACYVDDYDNSANYAGQVREIIYKLFKDNGIEIPYNRLQLDILSGCDGRKRPDDHVPDD